jgi:hypothetical protein
MPRWAVDGADRAIQPIGVYLPKFPRYVAEKQRVR